MDEPGFMIGTQAEQQATIRYGLEAIFAVQQTAVPWFTVIVRRSFGVAAGCHLGPGGIVVAWPSAQSGALPLESGIALAYGKRDRRGAGPGGAPPRARGRVRAPRSRSSRARRSSACTT